MSRSRMSSSNVCTHQAEKNKCAVGARPWGMWHCGLFQQACPTKPPAPSQLLQTTRKRKRLRRVTNSSAFFFFSLTGPGNAVYVEFLTLKIPCGASKALEALMSCGSPVCDPWLSSRASCNAELQALGKASDHGQSSAASFARLLSVLNGSIVQNG